jgi:Zn-dependent metalloprotease
MERTGGRAQLRLSRATGTVRFLRVEPGDLRLTGRNRAERAQQFLRQHGRALGAKDALRELVDAGELGDPLGHHRRRYVQRYRGIPVFAAELRLHFDAQDELVAVNGTLVPGIDVNPVPTRNTDQAGRIALEDVGRRFDSADSLQVADASLLVFRQGLILGVPGPSHLAWRVEVTNNADVREFVFVDAHTGKVLDRITGIQTAMHRRVHQSSFGNMIWDEGDALPYDTGSASNDGQVNVLVDTSQDVYDFFSNLSFGSYLSWNGSDALMHNIWLASFLNCPNASWNGQSTNYCDGLATDDVAAHEWGHAYTERTHGLIYQWQPGALNESYSDIFGEVVDQINGLGTDVPQTLRTAGACSTFGSTIVSMEVVLPGSIAGVYAVAGAGFNPAPPVSVTEAVELVNDGDDESGAASVTDACQPLVGFTAGNIALVDRGGCAFVDKVMTVQNAGAVGMIVVNDQGDGLLSMGGAQAGVTIPSVFLGQSDGDTIKAELGSEVRATLSLTSNGDPSVRWLMGEDSSGGAIRDLWNPNCYGHPARVTDGAYWCSSGDSGGVHINSGVPNHAFALLMDGGTYNGQSITALGLVKATNLYWRAMTVYQVPTSDFADHADALAQSCDDLLGQSLADPVNGGVAAEVISAADCDEVDEAMLAVDMTFSPAQQCGFTPILAQNPPAVTCENELFFDDFESDPTGTWTRTNQGVYGEYNPRDWQWTADVPLGGTGSAFFGLDSLFIGNCQPGSNDQSGVMFLDSPVIALDGVENPVLVFDHYVATEEDYDGGNLRVRVNGGAFQMVPSGAFLFNAYNGSLVVTNNTNPMAGEEAYHGTDGGSLGGSWGQSQVDLSGFAGENDTVQLRFSLGVDGCNGNDGWYVDNVRLCTDNIPNRAPDLADLGTVVVPEGGAVDVQLFATDPDGDGIVLSGSGLPAFATVLDQGAGVGRLQIRPGAGTSGSYAGGGVDATDDDVPPLSTLASVTIDVTACADGAPAGVVDMAMQEGLLSWTSLSGASWYRVMQGDVNDLAASGLTTGNCLSSYLDTTSLVDTSAPALGQALWFAVRGESCGGAGTFDSGGVGQVGDRDAGVENAGTCPVVGCGNGYFEGSELCGGADLNGKSCVTEGLDGGTLVCNATCSGFDASACTTDCGNGVQAGSESCDGVDLGGNTCASVGMDHGTLACDSFCEFNTSACTLCGDGLREDPEQCDSSDLNGESCISQGLDGGTLGCTGTCVFDLSECLGCGNNQIDDGELCDGFDRGGTTCQSLGYSSGILLCNSTCDDWNTTFCNP